MQIRQESDLDCEQIKLALHNINQRLNQLQKQIPHDVAIQKDPVIPKLNLNKLNKKCQQQGEQLFNQQLLYPQQIKNHIPQKIRSQSLNQNNLIQIENYRTQQYLLKQSIDQSSYQNAINKQSLCLIQQVNKENYQIQQKIIPQRITNQIIKNPTPLKLKKNINNNFVSQPAHPSSYVKIIQYYEMIDGTNQTVHKNSRSQSFHNIGQK